MTPETHDAVSKANGMLSSVASGTSSRRLSGWMLPTGVDVNATLFLLSRGLRGFCDGFIAVLLPTYLLALGFGEVQVGLIGSATLIGSALATLAVGALANRFPVRWMLTFAGGLMAATGLGFAGLHSLWPLVLVALVGTLNPGSGDVSVFLPLEQSCLAEAAGKDTRTALFARYSLVGAVSAALGSLAAGVPAWLAAHARISMLEALRAMFVLYSLTGVMVGLLYRRLPRTEHHTQRVATPLGPSRRIVARLALLFSVDAFAGGLLVTSLLSLWLMQRFDLSAGQAGWFFFSAGLLSAGSQLAAAPLAKRIGLVNTMVFTHIPANLCLIGAAFTRSAPAALALLLLRSALSQMDVPTRTAYVMAVVTPPERPAAASFTSVPRSLAAALAPTLAGGLLGAGWLAAPLIACGALKVAYDLSLFAAFRHIKPSS